MRGHTLHRCIPGSQQWPAVFLPSGVSSTYMLRFICLTVPSLHSPRVFPFFAARLILESNGKRWPEHKFGTRKTSVKTLGLLHFLAIELLKLENTQHKIHTTVCKYHCQNCTRNLSQLSLPVYTGNQGTGTCCMEQGDSSQSSECGKV